MSYLRLRRENIKWSPDGIVPQMLPRLRSSLAPCGEGKVTGGLIRDQHRATASTSPLPPLLSSPFHPHRGRVDCTHLLRLPTHRQPQWVFRKYAPRKRSPAARSNAPTSQHHPHANLRLTSTPSIWRDPDEKTTAAVIKTDPTASSRSPIRRRPSVQGRHGRPRLPREATVLPPPFGQSAGNTAPPSRRISHIHRGVPPIETLLESARAGDSERLSAAAAAAPPPPPVPDSRNYYDEDLAMLESRDYDMRSSVIRLEETARRIDERTQALRRRVGDVDNEESRLARRLVAESSRQVRLAEALVGRSARREESRLRWSPRGIPTPPLSTSEPDGDGLFVPEGPDRATRPSHHPLRNSWTTPQSPVDGLGDRIRSPTPQGDGWEVMRTTITPDATLPSADSSFTSAVAANHSFASTILAPQDQAASSTTTSTSNPATTTTSTPSSPRASSSASSVDLAEAEADALACDSDSDSASSSTSSTHQSTPNPSLLARAMFALEDSAPAGRARIAAHTLARSRTGNRFGLAHEPPLIDLGLRLIEEALADPAGRERLSALRAQPELPHSVELFEAVVDARRRRIRRDVVRNARTVIRADLAASSAWLAVGAGAGDYASAEARRQDLVNHRSLREVMRVTSPRRLRLEEQREREARRAVGRDARVAVPTPVVVGVGGDRNGLVERAEGRVSSEDDDDSEGSSADDDDDAVVPAGANAAEADSADEDASSDEDPDEDDSASAIMASAQASLARARSMRDRVVARANAALAESPIAYPVSPPTERRSGRAVIDGMRGEEGEEGEEDVGAMRRVVERLARRGDVPAEWWGEIGVEVMEGREREGGRGDARL